MISLIVVTHGSFSKELINSAELIYGTMTDVYSVTFSPGEGHSDLIDRYKEIISAVNSDSKFLFMVDLFGGSPYNTASMLAIKDENIDVITGVNLPMLLEVYGSKDNCTLSELVSIAESSAKDSIRSLKKMMIVNEGDDLL